jgi:hypothetical protein
MQIEVGIAMKRTWIFVIVAAALLVLTACSSSPPLPNEAAKGESPVPAASVTSPNGREPLPGCEWRGSVDPSIRLYLLVQECTEGAHKYSFLAYGNAIYQVPASAGGEIAKGKRIVEVFEKPAGQPIAEALQEQFIAKLPSPAKEGCLVRSPAAGVKVADPTKSTYEIVPGPAYKGGSEAGSRPCGDYGKADSPMYFEYHPRESRVRFLFVNAGGDPPMFDAQAIRLR